MITPKNATLRYANPEWVDTVLCRNYHQIFLRYFDPQSILVSVALTGLKRGLVGLQRLLKVASDCL